MVKSMTGYGRAREMRGGRDITVEVRSVNNRYLDCTVKMPRAYIFAEDAIKTMDGTEGITGSYAFDEFNNPIKPVAIIELTGGNEVYQEMF